MTAKSTFWMPCANLSLAVSHLEQKEIEQLYAELLLRRRFSKQLVDGLLASTHYTASNLYDYHQRNGGHA